MHIPGPSPHILEQKRQAVPYMAATEQKLRLLRQIRLEQTRNTQAMHSREAILYGKPVFHSRNAFNQRSLSYHDEDAYMEDESDGRGHNGTGRSTLLPRIFVTVALCAGLFYLLNQASLSDEGTPTFLGEEQTAWMKDTLQELLTRDDLSTINLETGDNFE